ncbi:MAG TPA: glycosyl hydrolase family 65 protein [Actinomycetales bacterium]|nr:glycosyl hydrolase family 65 protein [Actinomycetales bacterium]
MTDVDAAGPTTRSFAAVVVPAWLDTRVGSGDAFARVLKALAQQGVEVLVAKEPPSDDALEVALAEAGVGPGLALFLGVPPPSAWTGATVVSGGPSDLLAALTEQLDCQRADRVPGIDPDPAWVITVIDDAPMRRRADESVLALADGHTGTRGSVEEDGPGTAAAVFCAGLYTGLGSGQRLLPCPSWSGIPAPGPTGSEQRWLDLRTGVLLRERISDDGASYRSLRVAFATTPGLVGLRAETTGTLPRTAVLDVSPVERDCRSGRIDRVAWAQVRADPVGGVAVAGRQRRTRMGDGPGEVTTLEWLVGYVADPRQLPTVAGAMARLEGAEHQGFGKLLGRHRRIWASRWKDADIELPDDLDLQRAVRFGLFHLMSSASDLGEAAVGARGLTGPGYSGHVFWDADVFVLPALAAIAPRRARAMVEYRIRRLEAARAHAAASGRQGARFPWESARDGSDVTPRTGVLGGRVVPILTGDQQEHITADVAWGAWQYARWTGDESLLLGPAAPLLVETARYWASRVRREADGTSHIDRVIGPDEYHVGVDDNAFTNVMARWNLRVGADVAERAAGCPVAPGEVQLWRDIADGLVDGFDAETCLYEQFAGYDELEPLLVGDVATPPVAADLLLGQERVTASQLIKQPDVLMLHHMVPAEVEPGSLAPNLAFYGPRTSHGSSLSPGIHASLCARAGQTAEAQEYLRTACLLDLADTTGVTASGLHLATFGAMWQAIAFGFLGMYWDGAALRVEPRLPDEWTRFSLRCRVRGRRLIARLSGSSVEISTDRPMPMSTFGEQAHATSHLLVPRKAERPLACAPR